MLRITRDLSEIFDLITSIIELIDFFTPHLHSSALSAEAKSTDPLIVH